MTSLSVVAWVNEKYTLPSVSSAASKASLGFTDLYVTLQVASVGHHIRRE